MNSYNNDRQHIANCIMVDTLGLRVKNVHAAKLPKAFAQISDDPELAINSQWSKANVIAKSGKPSLRVRSIKKNGDLTLEGSNAIHYQGHNIVSSNDVSMSAFSMLHATKEQHELKLKQSDALNFARGEGIEVTRIDTPIMLKIPHGLKISDVINALSIAGIKSGVNTSIYIDETAYFEQHSQEVSLKAYDKSSEIEKKRSKIPLPDTNATSELLKLAQNTIRFEAVYRAKYFKHNPRFKKCEVVTPSMLTPEILAMMFMELLEKYDFKGSLRQYLLRSDIWNIQQPYRATVAMWQSSFDLLKMFDNNKSKLQRHQRVIKKDYGINIFAPPPGKIYDDIQLGDILRIENFIPVPPIIRDDPTLFYEPDMAAEHRKICQQMKLPRGIGSVYINPNRLNDK